MTIIPAHPGYTVTHTVEADDGTETVLGTVPIIAWLISDDGESVIPITHQGARPAWDGGTSVRSDVNAPKAD